jgi:sortase A
MRTRDLVIRRAAAMLVVIGVMMLSYTTFVLADAWRFRAEYHASLPARAAAPASAPAPLIEGSAIGEIRIERLGLLEVIGEGDSATVLRRGVGHLADTAWLGRPGNIVLAGHRDTAFRALSLIQTGDRIEVTTPHERGEYEVQSATVVPPTDTSVLAPSDRNTLTLITCFPFAFVGRAPERFVVRAREIERVGSGE